MSKERKRAIEMTTDEAMEHLFEPQIVDCIRELTREDESDDEENGESREE